MKRIAAVLAAGLIAGAVYSTAALEIVAHRGASHDAPENTVSAMKLGMKQQADRLECDVYLTKDGKIAVFHDSRTQRIGGVDKKVGDQTWDELQQLDAGSWKGPQWKGEKIPSLDAVLATVKKDRGIFVEIKCGSEILPALDEAFKKSGLKAEQIAIICFTFDVCRDAKKMFPQHEVYWLQGWKQDKDTGKFPKIEDLIAQAKSANLDGLDLQDGFPIDAAFVAQVKAAGLKLYTWTVDDAAVARKQMEAGVDGITTNRPQWLRRQLGLPAPGKARAAK